MLTLGSKFRIVETFSDSKVSWLHEPLVQELEKDLNLYKLEFLPRKHYNFLSLESHRGPVSLSLMYDGNSYKAILRSGQGNQKFSILESQIHKSFWKRILKLEPSFNEILYGLNSDLVNLKLSLVKNVDLSLDLIQMEESLLVKSFKFGVLYVSQGQSTEFHSLSNTRENCSLAFDNFCKFLGEEIELANWKGYRGGLDTSGKNTTGKTSIYTRWQGFEVMFHISTWLPFNSEDSQRIDKKRHIGNDIVVLIFQESLEPFQLSSIVSKQNHIIVLVQPIDCRYKITVATKIGVGEFTPHLPEPTIISNDAMSREFLFHILINSEVACYFSRDFAPKLERTRSVLIADLALKYLPENE